MKDLTNITNNANIYFNNILKQYLDPNYISSPFNRYLQKFKDVLYFQEYYLNSLIKIKEKYKNKSDEYNVLINFKNFNYEGNVKTTIFYYALASTYPLFSFICKNDSFEKENKINKFIEEYIKKAIINLIKKHFCFCFDYDFFFYSYDLLEVNYLKLLNSNNKEKYLIIYKDLIKKFNSVFNYEFLDIFINDLKENINLIEKIKNKLNENLKEEKIKIQKDLTFIKDENTYNIVIDNIFKENLLYSDLPLSNAIIRTLKNENICLPNKLKNKLTINFKNKKYDKEIEYTKLYQFKKVGMIKNKICIMQSTYEDNASNNVVFLPIENNSRIYFLEKLERSN